MRLLRGRRSVRCPECGATAIATSGPGNARRSARAAMKLHLLALHPDRYEAAGPMTLEQWAAIGQHRRDCARPEPATGG